MAKEIQYLYKWYYLMWSVKHFVKLLSEQLFLLEQSTCPDLLKAE